MAKAAIIAEVIKDLRFMSHSCIWRILIGSCLLT
jgi:hypothetical protein